MSLNNMRRILSQQTLTYIKDKAKLSTQYGKYMATYVSVFTMIMKTCKGRDKICSVIQYIAQFYYNCNKYSEIEQVLNQFRANRNYGAAVAHKLKIAMKNSRKIFKFLKFLDHMSSIVKTVQSKKPIYLKLVTIVQHLMSLCSSIFNNIIWGIDTDVLATKYFRQHYKSFKAKKYFFSLVKIIFKMLSSNFKHHDRVKNMKEILAKLKYYREDQMQVNGVAWQLCKDYLKHRMELRVEGIDGAIMMFRVVMLVRKLKLPGHSFVTKILYSACGLVSTLLSVCKMVLDQPLLVQIKQKQVLQQNNNSTESLQGKLIQERQKVQKIKITRAGSFRIS